MQRNANRWSVVGLFVLFVVSVSDTHAAEPATESDAAGKRAHALVIGVDGLRPDALKAASTPNLDALIVAGAYANNAHCLPERDTGGDTVSGPSWSSILTGVWADKHGVVDNKFKNKQYDRYPHFFARVKQARPDSVTASVVTWTPIAAHIVSAADVNVGTGKDDDKTTKQTVELLAEKNPLAVFVHLDKVDGAGHRHGFSPDVAEYLKAIEKVDAQIGAIVNAVRSRKTYADESWIIVLTSDHGGRGKGHGGGQKDPQRLQVPLIVNGPGVAPQRIREQTFTVDVVPTVLKHLGIEIDPSWKLDGRAVGLGDAPAGK